MQPLCSSFWIVFRSSARARRTGRYGVRRCWSRESWVAGRVNSSCSSCTRAARYGSRALSNPWHRADKYMAELGPYRFRAMYWQTYLHNVEALLNCTKKKCLLS